MVVDGRGATRRDDVPCAASLKRRTCHRAHVRTTTPLGNDDRRVNASYSRRIRRRPYSQEWSLLYALYLPGVSFRIAWPLRDARHLLPRAAFCVMDNYLADSLCVASRLWVALYPSIHLPLHRLAVFFAPA